MPLIVQPAEDSDATRIAEIERLAYADSALTPILFPGPFPPDALAMRAEGLIAQRQADPTIRWLKVVDTDTNELIAFAKWNIINMPTPWTQSSQSSQQTQETQQQQQQEPNKSSRQFGPGCNVEACEEFFGGIHRRRDELVGGKECCILDLLQTDPKHQGRGAGSMLIRWGLDLADELRVPAYLESSPAAHKLYTKHGFRDIGQFTMDPKWNCHVNPAIYFMVRDVS